MHRNRQPLQYVVCIRSKGFSVWLKSGKIYRKISDPLARKGQLIRVIDDSGEDYLYSADYFLLITLPVPVQGALQPGVDVINRVPVKSSTIASLGYDAQSETLDLEFKKSGEVYRYLGVTPAEYQELMNATSLGTYVNRSFKPKGHEFEVIFLRSVSRGVQRNRSSGHTCALETDEEHALASSSAIAVMKFFAA